MIDRAYYLAIITGTKRGLVASVLRLLLRVLQLPYFFIILLREQLYRSKIWHSEQVAVPVICVGNISLGGTGKTPMVEWLARQLLERGYLVALISRGYRPGQGGVPDEAMMLEENLPELPHFQNPKRVEAARLAIEELECDILILDDGFQHRRLHRDVDLVLVDAMVCQQKQYLIPRGFLREPFSALRRASAVIITRRNQVSKEEGEKLQSQISRYVALENIFSAEHLCEYLMPGNLSPETYFPGRPVALFCGIGNPHSFAASIRQCGAKILDHRIFPDHHPYTAEDLVSLCHWAEQLPDDTDIITTQKDMVKIQCDRLAKQKLYSLRISMHVHDASRLFEQIIEPRLHRAFPQPSSVSEIESQDSSNPLGNQ